MEELKQKVFDEFWKKHAKSYSYDNSDHFLSETDAEALFELAPSPPPSEDKGSGFMNPALLQMCEDVAGYVRDNYPDWRREDVSVDQIGIMFRTWLYNRASKFERSPSQPKGTGK